jgi:hypothetical protein
MIMVLEYFFYTLNEKFIVKQFYGKGLFNKINNNEKIIK